MDMIDGQAPVFNERTGHLRFWVPTAQGSVAAYLSANTWRASQGSLADGCNMKEVYQQHRDELNASVLRRVQGGARTPVVLMAADL